MKIRIPFLRGALWYLFRRWAIRQADAAFIFTRYDGVEAEVDCCACARCKNFFWVQHIRIEPPKACPYCAQKFSGVVHVAKDEFDKIQIL